MSNINGRPPIDAYHQVPVHMAKQGTRILEIDQPDTRIAYGGHVC
jgi:hypothetical protein